MAQTLRIQEPPPRMQPESRKKQNIDGQTQCVLCGRENPLSFNLQFERDDQGGVIAEFTGNESFQGYQGIMHGGVLSALLDTAMAQCLLHQDIEAVTGELNVRFFDPVDCNSVLSIQAWVDSSLPPLYHLKSHIIVNERIVCKGKAKFMQRSENKTQKYF